MESGVYMVCMHATAFNIKNYYSHTKEADQCERKVLLRFKISVTLALIFFPKFSR